MELVAITRDVYACLQEDRGLGWSNSGLVARGGGLVVDTLWDLPRTRALIDQYTRVVGGPLRRLVNTHHNGDHCWGNQLFDQAEIIGHRLCAEAMRKETPPAVFAAMLRTGQVPPGMERFFAALAQFDFSDIELTPPTTLVEERLDIDLDGLAVEILYVGPAHTQSDVIVHVPERRVVFAGDVVFRNCTPIGWEGTYGQWLAALERLIALAPDVVVPGHGPLTDAAGLRELASYLEYVRAESRRFFDAGLDELEASKRIDLGPYADWTEPERIVFNVNRAYREFRGEPYDAPIDVPRLIRAANELSGYFEHDGRG